MQPNGPVEAVLIAVTTSFFRVCLMAANNLVGSDAAATGNAPPPLIPVNSEGIVDDAVQPPLKRFYSVTVGKTVGVFDVAKEAQDSVKNIPGSALRKFPTQRLAAEHFNDELALGNVRRVITDQTEVNDATHVPVVVIPALVPDHPALPGAFEGLAADPAANQTVAPVDAPPAVPLEAPVDAPPAVASEALGAFVDSPTALEINVPIVPPPAVAGDVTEGVAAGGKGKSVSATEVATYIDLRRREGRIPAQTAYPEAAALVKGIRMDAIKAAVADGYGGDGVASGSGVVTKDVVIQTDETSPSVHDSDLPSPNILDDVSEGTYGGDPEHRAMILRARAEARENQRIADLHEYEELVDEAQEQ